MSAFLVSFIASAIASGAKFPCPSGLRDVEVEWVHVQDFRNELKGQRNEIVEQLLGVITDLKDTFGVDSSRMTLYRSIDKYVNGELTQYNDCDEATIGRMTEWFDGLDSIMRTYLTPGHMWGPDGDNHLANVFDSAAAGLNEWAKRGAAHNPATGKEVVRVMTMYTNECARVRGRYEKLLKPSLFPDLVSAWESGQRKISFPLNGNELVNCKVRDYPTLEEIGSEVARSDVNMSIFIEGKDAQCADAQFYSDSDAKMDVLPWWEKARDTLAASGGVVNLDTSAYTENLRNSIMASIVDAVCE